MSKGDKQHVAVPASMAFNASSAAFRASLVGACLMQDTWPAVACQLHVLVSRMRGGRGIQCVAPCVFVGRRHGCKAKGPACRLVNVSAAHFLLGMAPMGRPWKKLQSLENKFNGSTPTNPWKKNLIPWKRNLSTQPEPGWRGVGGEGAAPPPHMHSQNMLRDSLAVHRILGPED